MRRTPMGFILFSFLSFFLLEGTNCFSTNVEFSEENPLPYLRARQGKTLLIEIETLQKWARHGSTHFNLDENGLYTVEVLEKQECPIAMTSSTTSPVGEQRASIRSATVAFKMEETSRERFLALSPKKVMTFIPLKGRTNIPHGYWFCDFENTLKFFIAEKLGG